jgi:hypothetical protein
VTFERIPDATTLDMSEVVRRPKGRTLTEYGATPVDVYIPDFEYDDYTQHPQRYDIEAFERVKRETLEGIRSGRLSAGLSPEFGDLLKSFTIETQSLKTDHKVSELRNKENDLNIDSSILGSSGSGDGNKKMANLVKLIEDVRGK